MADQVFNFPGFYDREIDLTARVVTPQGVPGGVIGASLKGPAFVPSTLGSFSDFITKFGDLNSKLAAPYAVEKFLQNRTSLTFVRVLGAGVNQTTSDFETTRTNGTVRNAGFKVSGTLVSDGRHQGAVQFIVAKHQLTGSEAYGFPMFTDNNSFLRSGSADEVYLVRGAIMPAYDTRVMLLDYNQSWATNVDDMASVNPTGSYFKLVLSSSTGATFGTADGFTGLRIYTASLDPSSDYYFAKLLNRDPSKFDTERHYLYADFAVDNELAHVSTGSNSVVVASGSGNASSTSGNTSLTMREAFGRFDTRYKAPKTPWFISQPFGTTEYDLFYVEAIDDGEYSNTQIKVSIVNIVASTNPRNAYGTFTLVVRQFADSDLNPAVIEQFTNVTLDPDSDSYIAKVIGDSSIFFNFDVENSDDRRLVRRGKYPNRSKYIRVVMNEQVDQKFLPADVLPFGFRGPEVLDTNSLLSDITGTTGFSSIVRLGASGSALNPRLLGAIIPPVPYRFKVTRGQISTGSGQLTGAPGSSEITDNRFYWGVKFERNDNDILNTNVNGELNQLIPALTKLAGIAKLDVPVTGAYKDTFNNNKFTLARVALGNTSFAQITASANVHMREACYIRNGSPDATEYKITDGSTARLTLASLVHSGTQAMLFNKFSDYAKFTVYMYGGFDGTNTLDPHAATFDDRSTSTEARGSIYGNSNASFSSPGFNFNQNGVGINNNQIYSYRVAADIITNTIASNINLLAIPGQREPLVTDYVSDDVENYGLAVYLMDIPNYNSDGNRIFDGETANSATYIDVENTADEFETRALDNTIVASYFPDVVIDDSKSGRKVTVPASVAALAAIGYNDKVAYSWFAPAGFNRAALNFVSLTKTRLKQEDRDRMYQVRVNPIVKFPNEGYVIFSQKTLDANATALDSINVQRMVLEVQRQIIDVGNRLIFEQLSPGLYAEFVAKVTPILANVQNRQGLKQFRVVCDVTNNSELDRENNRMNVKIFLLPVKAIEFIQLDFIITRNGVSFGS
ncbi:MAG: hypothetical protein WC761_01400 [Candidatus Paceibacterota bacterium]|jgi:hypothetical protein